jgi:hypothetical protein
MALISIVTGWLAGSGRLAARIDAAEALTKRLQEAGPPPGLPTRHRANFDRAMDALNRLPRPVMVLGSLALVASALIAPVWFAARMDTLASMPEGLWWLIGAVLSLHWGARYQAHAQDFDRAVVEAVAQAAPSAPEAATPAVASPGTDAAVSLDSLRTGPNAALAEWAGPQAKAA